MSIACGRIARLMGAVLMLGQIVAAQPVDHPDLAALEAVRPRLFRVASTAARKAPKGGTAYLLKIAKEDDQCFAYFATCYHVVSDRDQVDLYPTPKCLLPNQPNEAVATFMASERDPQRHGPQSSYKIRLIPTLDLVLLRAPTLEKELLQLPEDTAGAALPAAYVFGFPSFDSRRPYPLSVFVAEGSQPAIGLGFYQPNAGVDEPRMEVRFLTREITYPGMSGGPVLDSGSGRYAGMLLGRMPEPAAAPVLLASRQIFEQLGMLDWKAFDPNDLKIDLPYKKDKNGKLDFGQYMNDASLSSELDWTSFDQWSEILENDPTPFLRDFQEASVRLDEMKLVTGSRNEAALSFANIGSVPTGQPADKHHIDFRWNGKLWDPALPAPLRSGENLLIVSKSMDADGTFINDLFRSNPIHVELRLDGKRAFGIQRSLPALIRRYSIFVTIHNGDVAEAAANDNYVARLAVRLDFLNRLVNQVPFQLPIQGSEPKLAAQYDGMGKSSGDYLRLKYISPQTLDAELTSTITINKLNFRFSGVKVTFPAPNKPPGNYTLTMGGRVQFPTETPAPGREDDPSLFFVSPRAHAARSDTALPVPLFSDDVEVDIGPVVREALVCYVNKELLIPEKAAVPGPDQLNKLLTQIGALSHLVGYKLVPIRAFLKREDGAALDALDRQWAILTFRLTGPDGKAVKVATAKPSLIPDESLRRDLGMEFVAIELPVATATTHLVRTSVEAQDGNQLGREITSQAAGRVIIAEQFRLAVLKDALPPIGDALILDGKAEKLGDGVGNILRAAFTNSAKKIEADLAPSTPIQLLAALPVGARLLAANPQFNGQLRLVAETNSEGKDVVTLKLGERGYTVTWAPKVVLAGAMTATGLSVHLTKGDLTGQLAASTFSGRIEGKLTADEIKVGNETFKDVQITLNSADVDSARIDTEQLHLCLDVEVGNWQSPGKDPVPFHLKGIRLKFGTGTLANQAMRMIIKSLLDALVFANNQC